MKEKLIVIAAIFIWVALSLGVGTLLLNLFKSMTDFITISDIIGCYFFPLLIFGYGLIHFLIRR